MSHTRVGIVEWGHRVHGARVLEMTAADALGRAVATADGLGGRLTLVARACAHAWRAEQWRGIVPVLHDVTLEDPGHLDVLDATVRAALQELRVASDAPTGVRSDVRFCTALATTYERWLDETTPIADAPYRVVLRRVLHDSTVDPFVGEAT